MEVYINKRALGQPAASLGPGDQRDFSHFRGLWLPRRVVELCLLTSRRLSWFLALSPHILALDLLNSVSQTPSCVLGPFLSPRLSCRPDLAEKVRTPHPPVNATTRGAGCKGNKFFVARRNFRKGPRVHKHCHSVQSLAGLVAVPVDVTCMLTADHSPSAPAPVPRAHPLLHHPQAALSTIAKHHECSWHWGR